MSVVADAIDAVRESAPMVHCIGPGVSASLVADGLLAAGARPMMTATASESPTLVAAADALSINLGMLTTDGAEAIPPTITAARNAEVPWVLDPAAIGLAPVRTPLATSIVTERPVIVRGNASEILALHGSGKGGRGADTVNHPDQALAAGTEIARAADSVVAISGLVDLITDGRQMRRVALGSMLLPQVTGTGCLLGALMAACSAVATPWASAVTASAWLGVAGEMAELRASGPGSFRVALIDALAAVTPDEVADRAGE